jgi:metallo-beta-lactamase family protein
MNTTLHFFGGAGTVTGSNFLLQSEKAKILIDCGLFQSAHACEETNWSVFPYDPKSLDILLVSHAHIDHIGRIPRLVKEGFAGKIYSTEATKALAEPLLLDSMELLRSEAHRCGREPLYTQEDVERALSLWQTLTYHEPLAGPDEFSIEFLNAGHILGSAMVRITRNGKSLLVSGDLGGGNSPLLPPHDEVKQADYLLIESVYGDKVRGDTEHRRDELENIIENTVARGGTLLIPAFSTERTQDLIFEIRTLMVEKRVPSVPVFVDSPLAQKITEAFSKYPAYFNNPIRQRIEKGEHIFSFPELHFVEDIEESKKIAHREGSKIIIAGSGMSNGGRVHEHERVIFSDPKSTLLIVGYQAAGSLGRRLIEGEKKVVLRGEKIAVSCRIEALYAYSAHMDGEELLQFVSKIAGVKEIFVVHGEPLAAATLTQRIRDYLGVRAIAPEVGKQAKFEL